MSCKSISTVSKDSWQFLFFHLAVALLSADPFVQVFFPPRQKTLQAEQNQKVFNASKNSLGWLEDELAPDGISFNNAFHR